MIAADVDDLDVLLLHLLQQGADKVRVLMSPPSGGLQGPGVDDVAIEDDLIADAVAEKVRGLHRLGVCHAEMDIGHDERLDSELGFHAWRDRHHILCHTTDSTQSLEINVFVTAQHAQARQASAWGIHWHVMA